MRTPLRKSFWHGALACLVAFLAAVAAWRSPRTHAAGPAGAAADSPPAPRRVKVLFLGDTGHHVPLERARQIYSVLGRRGIDLTYTDDLADLNPQTLGRYDCLLLYANWTTIAPEQEQALLDYVTAGHGFVPLHCGSYCFLNSPKITALIGGRFKSHSTGVFKETIAQPDHPIERGLKPIESWDETYVHEMHNEKDRTVLAYRVEGDRREPYTWTRTEGKGRVFYTAWGHDQRTWGNENFQDLLDRGIRWAAGDWALQPQPALKPFEYSQGAGVAALPNYIPGEKWGTTGDLITRIQEPLPAAESMKHMTVPPGFDIRLFASDPDIKKPICMAFDERGRLWVAETFDYPNQMQPEGQGRDQITICEDTDGDGVADKFTVFADKLSIPTSMVFASGGVIVSQAPHMLFLKDTDGDGRADVRKVLFTGFGTRDTHAGPSNLRWGLDGWVYATCGYSGYNGDVGGQHVSFGQGVFRFKPEGDSVSKLEFLGSTNNNTWGLGLSEDFEVFVSTANHNPAFYLGIPNRYFETVRGWSPHRPATIADDWHFSPITPQVRQVDQHGGYTAGAGAALYTARSFPRNYWNRINFVAEPTGHLLGQFELIPSAAGGFVARNNFSLLASDDEWTAPITGEVGPDGSLWMIDWYNIIVQHNPVPKGFQVGKGGAYETPLRDKRHGRVYRITFKDAKPSQTYDLSKPSAEQLVEALKSDNMLWRTHAQRLLVERGSKEAVPALEKLVADNGVDGIGLNPAAVHALWAMSDLGVLDGSNGEATIAVVNALRHPSGSVRKTALMVLPRNEASAAAVLGRKVINDPDPLVRKAALLALSEMPPSDEAGAAAYTALAGMGDVGVPVGRGRGRGAAAAAPAPRPAADPNAPPPDTSLADAAIIAAARHDAGFLKAVVAAHPRKDAAPEAGAQAANTSKEQQPANLLPNPSFENEQNGAPIGWRRSSYGGGSAVHEWAGVGHTGSHSLMIRVERGGADTGWTADVPCEPNTDYRLSAWIKTQDVQKVGSGLGALLNIHNLQGQKTPAVTGTTDWKRVDLTFNSGSEKQLTINCLFGGWGQARGTAWYDDIELVKARGGASGLPGTVGQAVAIVTNHYAQRAPSDSVIATLAALKAADPAVAAAVVDGLAGGWPEGKPPKLSDADVAELRAVLTALPQRGKDRMLSLAGKWGRKDLFANELAAASRDLEKAVADAALGADKRGDAARRLIAVADNKASADLILKEVNPKTPPDVQTALLKALGDSRAAGVGEALVARWGTLTPTSQKTAMDLLLRRETWTAALLKGIEAGNVNGKDLLPQQWQVLTGHPDPQLATQAKALEKSSGRAVSPDRKAIVDKFLPLASKSGDPEKGRLVYEKNCMVCHTLEGKGGKVGPELTGVGAKPKGDILIDVLDPNRSVEGTFRQWTAKTEDDVIAGRLATESKTSVEILDAAGQTHTLQRDQIKSLTASDRSVMPEGFEQLPPEDLTNLLELLASSKVKH